LYWLFEIVLIAAYNYPLNIQYTRAAKNTSDYGNEIQFFNIVFILYAFLLVGRAGFYRDFAKYNMR